VRSPDRMAGPLSTNTTMATAAINISPPMVGVPLFGHVPGGSVLLDGLARFPPAQGGTKIFAQHSTDDKAQDHRRQGFDQNGIHSLTPPRFSTSILSFLGPAPFSPGGRARRTYIIAYSVGKRKQFLLFRPDGPAGCRSPARSHGPCPPAESRPPPVPWTGPAGWRPAGPAAGPRR